MAANKPLKVDTAVKFIGITQDEAEAILDSGLFKIRANPATRSFVLKMVSIIKEFADEAFIEQAEQIIDHENQATLYKG